MSARVGLPDHHMFTLGLERNSSNRQSAGKPATSQREEWANKKPTGGNTR